ncbi:winged helix-turn-helix domain-containing protein [Rhizobium leguminosarum]|uniref:winged helix-turn-helix domain-containing protein n=1 Tax=Rhizobium leguminosarum TaxID=384 RepID=UPI00396575D2
MFYPCQFCLACAQLWGAALHGNFLRNRGRTVLRSSLEGQVYSVDNEIQSNSLALKMSRLRRKLAKRRPRLLSKTFVE